MDPHYLALLPAYLTAAGIWFLVYYFTRSPWEHKKTISFKESWLEFIYGVIAVLVILGMGQLYIREMLIPTNGSQYLDALNQLLIFSPAIILILIRKHSARTIWLPGPKLLVRLAIGLAIAVSSLFVYWIFRKNAPGFVTMLSDIYHPKNISYALQIFMEDITIALLFVRISAWIGRRWSLFIVALLFAAGHIPAMISTGYSFPELGSLFIDAFLGVIILAAVSKSQDIIWFFMVHFVLDMTQFYA